VVTKVARRGLLALVALFACSGRRRLQLGAGARCAIDNRDGAPTANDDQGHGWGGHCDDDVPVRSLQLLLGRSGRGSP
jgi:hypothetical protein